MTPDSSPRIPSREAGAARAVRVAIGPTVDDDRPEVEWTLRVLLRIAGYGMTVVDANADDRVDVAYGSDAKSVVSLARGRLSLREAGTTDPTALEDIGPVPRLVFPHLPPGPAETKGPVPPDVVFAAFWLLTGAGEVRYGRDRWDNLGVIGSPFHRLGLARRPLVSEWGVWLRSRLQAAGLPAADWRDGGQGAAFVLSHDVDYPEILRGIETVRALISMHARRAWIVATGGVDFWRFDDWMALSERLGGRSTFFFMARRGSLLEYARGTPDAFYDVRSDRFRTLFDSLAERGHEVGLHLSFHAHRSARTMAGERERLQEVSGTEVVANRHHYWHLDPDDPPGTLRRQVEAGLEVDSSFGLELLPGFRRGIAHPFRPWDPEARAEFDLVEVPPTWMDDHFDRRRASNGIEDPVAEADGLLAAAARTGGVAVLDYHVRGMEDRLFPRYGAWLERFLDDERSTPIDPTSMRQVVDAYLRHEASLGEASITDGANV